MTASVISSLIGPWQPEANATPKTRGIFRSIYSAASAVTEVEGPDGEAILSDAFPVRRGVVQGDVTSPLYFILALEAILLKKT